VLGEKRAKLVEYRQTVPDGARMILLIHSDGWPPSAHISNYRIMQNALKAARIAATGGDPQFDEVWWLDNAAISLESKLHRVA
jgi:hypothetical protein